MTASDKLQTPIIQTSRIVKVWRWVRLFLHVILCLLFVRVIYGRLNTAQRARFVRWWSGSMLALLNIRVRVRGIKIDSEQSNLIIVANHISWLDIFVINSVRSTRFVAKAEIRDWPIIGWLCDTTGTLFIRRARRSDTAKINQTIHDALIGGDAVGIFPEGTTTDGAGLHKFHTALFEPATVNDAFVAPTVLRYCDETNVRCEGAAFIGELSFFESLALIIGQPVIYATITFAPLINAADKNRRDVATLAQTAIANIMGITPLQTQAHYQPNEA